MRKITLFTLMLCWLLMAGSGSLQADDVLQLHKISNQVYAIIGPLGNRSAENLGNNASFGFVVTTEGVVPVPGHGPVTTLKHAQRDTRDYLVFLRQAVGEFIANGGGIENIGSIDQSRFKHLANFDELKGRDAQQVFQELELE